MYMVANHSDNIPTQNTNIGAQNASKLIELEDRSINFSTEKFLSDTTPLFIPSERKHDIIFKT